MFTVGRVGVLYLRTDQEDSGKGDVEDPLESSEPSGRSLISLPAQKMKLFFLSVSSQRFDVECKECKDLTSKE